MTVQSICKGSFSNIPNFDLCVCRTRYQVVTAGMEVYFEHCIPVSLIMLNLSLGAHIEQLDFLVLRTGSQACSVRIELCIVHDANMLMVLGDHRLELSIPHKHCLIVASRSNQSGIWRKCSNSYPVLMPGETELELFLLGSKDLQSLVVTSSQQ